MRETHGEMKAERSCKGNKFSDNHKNKENCFFYMIEDCCFSQVHAYVLISSNDDRLSMFIKEY